MSVTSPISQYVPPTTGPAVAPSAVELEREFMDYMNRFADAYQTYDTAADALGVFIPVVGIVGCNENTVESLVRKWIGSVCRRFDSLASNRSHIRLSRNHLSGGCCDINLRRLAKEHTAEVVAITNGESVCDLSIPRLIEIAKLLYPVRDLRAALISLDSGGIETAGFREAANGLASEFGLLGEDDGYHHVRGSLAVLPDNVRHVARKRGRVVLEMSYYGAYSHGRVAGLKKTRALVTSMENESGVAGLGLAIDTLIRAEESLSSQVSGVRVRSRTRLCAGHPVEVVCFKEKIEFHCTDDCFEGFIGFVREYASRQVSNIQAA